MKTAQLFLLFFLLVAGVKAQENNPVIHEGVVLAYNVYPNGGHVRSDLIIEKLSSDSIVIQWIMPGLFGTHERSGRRIMTRESIKNSNEGYWDPPYDGEHIVIPPTQSMLILSSRSFNELKQYGQTEFDKQIFVIKSGLSNKAEIGGKKINVIAIESKSGDTRMLVFDDARFPVIIKLNGNPFGVDIELLGIE